VTRLFCRTGKCFLTPGNWTGRSDALNAGFR
jgi:hypothetical protein